jgi:hypothetical protein
MSYTTNIHLKCECAIPFQDELTGTIKNIVAQEKNYRLKKGFLEKKEAISRELQSKMLSIHIAFSQPVKKLKPYIVRRLVSLLKKDVVAIIRVGDDDFTLFLH